MDIISNVLLRVSATILRILIIPSFAAFSIDAKREHVFSISILNPVLYQLGSSHAQRIQNTPPVLYGCLEIKMAHFVQIQSLNIFFEKAARIVGDMDLGDGQRRLIEPRIRKTSTIIKEWLLPFFLEPHKLYAFPFTMTLDPATIATISSRFVSVEYGVSASAQIVQYSQTVDCIEHCSQTNVEIQHPISIQCKPQPINDINCPTENYYYTQTEALGNWRDILAYNILVPQRIFQGNKFNVEILILPFQPEKFKILGVSIKLIEIISTCKADDSDEERDLTSDSDSTPNTTSTDQNVHTRVVSLHKQGLDEKVVRKCTDSGGRITIPISLKCPVGGKFGKQQAGNSQLGILQTVTNKRKLGMGIKHKIEVQFRLEEVRCAHTCIAQEHKSSTIANMIEECMQMAGPSAIQYHPITDEHTKYDPIEMTFLTKVIILDSLAQEGAFLVPKYDTEPSSSVEIPPWFQLVQPPPYK